MKTTAILLLLALIATLFTNCAQSTAMNQPGFKKANVIVNHKFSNAMKSTPSNSRQTTSKAETGASRMAILAAAAVLSRSTAQLPSISSQTTYSNSGSRYDEGDSYESNDFHYEDRRVTH